MRPAAANGVCQVIAFPGSLPDTTYVYDINNHGDVVGTYMTGGYEEWEMSVHGFVLRNGQYFSIDYPGASHTFANGMNDAGDVVGYATGSGLAIGFLLRDGQFTSISVDTVTAATDINNVGQIIGSSHAGPGPTTGFLRSPSGGTTSITFPGMEHSRPTKINDEGVVVGAGSRPTLTYSNLSFKWTAAAGAVQLPWVSGAYGMDGAAITNFGTTVVNAAFHAAPYYGSFIRGAGPWGRYSRLACPQSPETTVVFGINDKGAFIGYFWLPGSPGITAFRTAGVTLLDPVPDMLQGQAIAIDHQILGGNGRPVQGIAADGVSQIVVRIPAEVNELVTVTILAQIDPEIVGSQIDHYGAIGYPGLPCPGEGCHQPQMTVWGRNTTSGSFAFAIYRAPTDFVTSSADHDRAYRDVHLKIQSSAGTQIVPVRVVRPPVTLVHGLWSSWEMWENFAPLVLGPDVVDPRFSVMRASYDHDLSTSIVWSEPPYSHQGFHPPRANSLGFRYNAASLREQIQRGLQRFKVGHNPAYIAVAAVQTDVVGHSMGGTITRTLPLLTGYLGGHTFRQGVVHKLITINTPHLGSPIATRLLEQIGAGEHCLPNLLAVTGQYSFRTVDFVGRTVNGALGDLQHNPRSVALTDLAEQQVKALPMHMIGGVYTNWSALFIHPISLARTSAIRYLCAGDPLAQLLTPSGWPTIFNDEANDAVVSLASQRPEGVGTTVTGFLHSDGMTALGFRPPTVADPGDVPELVIHLLNTPVTNTLYFARLPQ